MPQYPSVPPPAAYVPSQSTPPSYGAQQQHQGYKQPQPPTTYQSQDQSHAQPAQSQKPSVGAFGQMMNQAVTTSKPMLDKLSKTISSKLGNKQQAPETPQHLQSYQSYQQHHGRQSQGHTQQYNHTYNPHVQQPQQVQPRPQAPSTYPVQQSPHQHSCYSSSQSGYPSPPVPPTPHTPYSQVSPPLPQQSSYSSYDGSQFSNGGIATGAQHGIAQQGQHKHGYMGQGANQAQYQQQPLHNQHAGQQTGIVGGAQQLAQASNSQSPHALTISPTSPAPHHSQWHNPSEQAGAPTYQQQSSAASTSEQSYFPVKGSQSSSNNYQWTPLTPTGAGTQHYSPVATASISPAPPAPPAQSRPPGMQSNSPEQPPISELPEHVHAAQPGPPKEFIAELPADLGSLSLYQAKPLEHVPVSPSAHTSPYLAYNSATAQAGPSSLGFTATRRAVSTSDKPYADPWRFADPLTELPTREFYVIADLFYEALDSKFEPQNTGLLEASKILRSWLDLTEDATSRPLHPQKDAADAYFFSGLFSYESYSAFGRLWSLQGIPHMMVPCQPSLSPIWGFDQNSPALELKLSVEHTRVATCPTYMPALNRAGWYKFFFLEMMHDPNSINKLMPVLCLGTYKPGGLHHPDLSRRDNAEAPALQARAAEIQSSAINRVCNETKAAMLADPDY